VTEREEFERLSRLFREAEAKSAALERFHERFVNTGQEQHMKFNHYKQLPQNRNNLQRFQLLQIDSCLKVNSITGCMK
jgi:hypothetical protein